MTVNPRTVTGRRTLRFRSLDDIAADVDRLDAAGNLSAGANWTPAQIVTHVAAFMEGSFDGFGDATAALPMRVLGRLLRKRALTATMQPGFRIPRGFAAMVPGEDVTWSSAAGRLRAVVDRARAGERMTQASPFLGPLTHEQWVRLHCRHAEMHFSFIHAG